MSDVFLSIILPVKNEAERLPLTLVDIDKKLAKVGFLSEIIVVSRSSRDNTPLIIKKMSEAIRNLRLITNEDQRGYGLALRQGMLLAEGQLRLVMNIDNLIDIDKFQQMKSYFENGADVVIGNRTKITPSILKVRKNLIIQPLNFLLSRLLFKGIKDPLSTFVAFRSEAVENIFNQTRYHFLENLLEPIFLAKKSGFKVQEAPLN